MPTRRKLLIVDDRLEWIDLLRPMFDANSWWVTAEQSLLDGIIALDRESYTAAIFDLKLPRPTARERLMLEKYRVPRAWVESVGVFSVGRVLGRYANSVSDGRLPYVYVSAMSSMDEAPEDDNSPVLEKLSQEYGADGIGQRAYEAVIRLLADPAQGGGEQ